MLSLVTSVIVIAIIVFLYFDRKRWFPKTNMPYIYYINYATGSHKALQEKNTRHALDWGANSVVALTPCDLDKQFALKNKKILDFPRGGGYWIWKPHVIRKALDLTKDQKDVLVVYCDSASFVDIDPHDLYATMLASGKDIAAAELEDQIEKKWVKGDLVAELKPPRHHLESPQIAATFICARNTSFTRAFFAEWERLVQLSHLVTDAPSEQPNDADFREHRHDQAIFSLLCKKNQAMVHLIPLAKLKHHWFD